MLYSTLSYQLTILLLRIIDGKVLIETFQGKRAKPMSGGELLEI
jgi:hypothetical protein